MDIDIFHPTAHKEKKLPLSIEEVEKFLSQLSLQPSIIINSGYGLHCYWILKEPWVFGSDGERQRAIELSKRFQQSILDEAVKNNWILDNTSDLARLLRDPGTSNKKQSSPVPVSMHAQNLNRYRPEDFGVFFTADHFSIPNPESKLPLPEKQVQSKGTPEAPQNSDSRNRQRVHELINRSAFLKHCKDNAAS